MSKLLKFGIVIGGYFLAFFLASGLVYASSYFRNSATRGSDGMSAFGDLILFVGVFGFFALFPTGLGLYFLFTFFSKKEPARSTNDIQ